MGTQVTFKGNVLNLEGQKMEIGQKAPDFTALKVDLSPVSLKDFKDKIKVFSVTPSLDTPVCDAQAKRFNDEATKLSNDVQIINISVDLPFAISRFCSINNINNIITLSDHKDVSFGLNYGLLIKELRLLTRAVVIVDKDDIIKYIQIVKEVTDSPDFEDVLNNINKII